MTMFNLRTKESIRYFTNQELKRLFGTMEKEEKESINTPFYKEIVRDEAFFKLLYFCAFRIRDLISLSLDSYNPITNEIRYKKSEDGVGLNLTLFNKKIVGSVKLHLKVNKPKKYLFESEDGKPISKELMEWRFPQYCELAGIKNEDKWNCQILRYTRTINLLDLDINNDNEILNQEAKIPEHITYIISENGVTIISGDKNNRNVVTKKFIDEKCLE